MSRTLRPGSLGEAPRRSQRPPARTTIKRRPAATTTAARPRRAGASPWATLALRARLPKRSHIRRDRAAGPAILAGHTNGWCYRAWPITLMRGKKNFLTNAEPLLDFGTVVPKVL